MGMDGGIVGVGVGVGVIGVGGCVWLRCCVFVFVVLFIVIDSFTSCLLFFHRMLMPHWRKHFFCGLWHCEWLCG